MADISRTKLKKEIADILKDADLTQTTAKKVRTQLEEKLEIDLANKKKIVDDLVMEYLRDQKDSKNDSEDEEEDDDENGAGNDDEEDSEEDKKKKKAPKRAAKKKESDSEDGSGEENSEEEEYSPKKKAKPAPKKGGRKKKGSESDSDEDWGKKKKKRGGGGAGGGSAKGYCRPLTLSKDLAKLMGQEQMPRHEVVKRMWALIKERNLYDPKNKQFAICDDELLKVIGEKRFRIFGMMKYLKSHFT